MHEPKKEFFTRIHKQLKHISYPYFQRVDCICFAAPENCAILSLEKINFMQSIMYLFQLDLSIDMRCFDAGPTRLTNVRDSHNVQPLKSYFVERSVFLWKTNEFPNCLSNMNVKRFDFFLNTLKISCPANLRLTIEPKLPAPDKIENLKTNIWDLLSEVYEVFAKLEETEAYVVELKQHKIDIMYCVDFSLTIKQIKQTRQSQNATFCVNCFFICHEKCGISDDAGKKGCSSMNDGICTVCTNKCIWSAHKNISNTSHYTSDQVTTSYREMKTKYEEEKKELLEFDEYLEHLDNDKKGLLDRIHNKIKRITECKNELQGIEKNPLAGSISDNIDEMINTERRRKENGYENKIKTFEKLKKLSM